MIRLMAYQLIIVIFLISCNSGGTEIDQNKNGKKEQESRDIIMLNDVITDLKKNPIKKVFLDNEQNALDSLSNRDTFYVQLSYSGSIPNLNENHRLKIYSVNDSIITKEQLDGKFKLYSKHSGSITSISFDVALVSDEFVFQGLNADGKKELFEEIRICRITKYLR